MNDGDSIVHENNDETPPTVNTFATTHQYSRGIMNININILLVLHHRQQEVGSLIVPPLQCTSIAVAPSLVGSAVAALAGTAGDARLQ